MSMQLQDNGGVKNVHQMNEHGVPTNGTLKTFGEFWNAVQLVIACCYQFTWIQNKMDKWTNLWKKKTKQNIHHIWPEKSPGHQLLAAEKISQGSSNMPALLFALSFWSPAVGYHQRLEAGFW